ncbi:hypothetical protein [Actinomadura roseirufa]|uniref:hypothetical protein n=1 Tax=Actinomadura roseirufa TaxID=2094049 RepID=UPI001040F4E9|nr:hypothetical protein [Actinomadura roseirufa]
MVVNVGKPEATGTRRGTRRRRRRESALVWWALFAAVGVAAWTLGSWRVGLLGLLGWCLYQFMFVPTLCRIMTRQGYSCRERARGRLFACGPRHQQVKNDSLWSLVGLRNPLRTRAARRAQAETGGATKRDTGVLVVSPEVRGRLAPADVGLILVAVAGTAVTLVGMVYGLL